MKAKQNFTYEDESKIDNYSLKNNFRILSYGDSSFLKLSK